MSMFGSIMNKIFHHDAAAPPAAPTSAPTPDAAPTDAGALNTTAIAAASPTDPAPTMTNATAPAAPVDVEAVLTEMAAKKSGGGGNWHTSIVDLLRLLDLDSSLTARKELADELNLHVGADGSAEENIALHHAVMQKLAENGGKVPDSLKA